MYLAAGRGRVGGFAARAVVRNHRFLPSHSTSAGVTSASSKCWRHGLDQCLDCKIILIAAEGGRFGAGRRVRERKGGLSPTRQVAPLLAERTRGDSALVRYSFGTTLRYRPLSEEFI